MLKFVITVRYDIIDYIDYHFKDPTCHEHEITSSIKITKNKTYNLNIIA